MSTNSNEHNELTPLVTQPTPITRRSFIKRTASAAMVTVIAVGAFKSEAYAQDEGESGTAPVAVIYTFKVGPLGQVTFLVPDGYVQKEGAIGQAEAIMKAITDAIADDKLHAPAEPPNQDIFPTYTKLILEERTPLTQLDDLLIERTPDNPLIFTVNYKPDGKTVKSITLNNPADGAVFAIVIRWARGFID